MKISILDYAGGASTILANNIKSAAGDTVVNVTIPDRYCSNCTLQWMWIPANEAPYYGCVDINVAGKVVAAASVGKGNTNTNTGKTGAALRTSENSFIVLVGCLLALLALVFQ